MIFRIDLAGAKPVYQQLMDQIKLAIAGGRIRTGDKLPTVRDLAAQLRINRNTVSRVYTELEREGVLFTRTGSGTFVGEQASPFSLIEQRRHLASLADDFIAQASVYGLSDDEIETFFQGRMKTIFQGGKELKKSATGGE